MRSQCNPAAVLGSLGPYPTLQLAPHRSFAWTDDAELMVDFTAWCHVDASAETFGNGTASLFNVVAEDPTNAHRVILPPDANHRAFAQMLHRYAARPGPSNEPAPEHPPAPWHARLAPRLTWLHQNPPGAQRLTTSDLLQILAVSHAERFLIQTGVYTPCVIQRAIWPLEEIMRTRSGLIWSRGADSFLELAPDAFAECWLVTARCLCCDEQRWTIECFTDNHRLAFTLQCGHPTDESRWRSLIHHSLDNPTRN